MPEIDSRTAIPELVAKPVHMASHDSISMWCEAGRGATEHGRGPVPMGRLHPMAENMGALLFVSRPSEDLRQAAVYYTQAHYGCGPFVDAYEHLGNVAQVYPRLPFNIVRGEVELTSEALSVLCGDDCRITLLYAIKNEGSGLDVYVQAYPQFPPNRCSLFRVEADDPMEWWRCRSYTYRGSVSIPASILPEGGTTTLVRRL